MSVQFCISVNGVFYKKKWSIILMILLKAFNTCLLSFLFFSDFELYIFSSASLNYDITSNYTLNVTCTDSSGQTATATIRVSLNWLLQCSLTLLSRHNSGHQYTNIIQNLINMKLYSVSLKTRNAGPWFLLSEHIYLHWINDVCL